MSDDNLATALAAFQAELPKVAKGATNTHFGSKYADLADVSSIVLPLLGKHGLSFSAKPTLTDSGTFVLEYTLRHVSGALDRGCYPLPASGTPQQIGSAITYARRYALCAVTGVAADEDDDGNATRDLPPAKPQQRHEDSWDVTEQTELREGYEAEIAAAKTADEITAIGERVKSAKKKGDLSPGTYNRLSGVAAKRRAELNGAAAASPAATGSGLAAAEAVTP